MRHALTSSGLAVVNAPFRECVVLSLRSKRSKRFRAEDRGFLSEAGQFPFGKPLTGVVRPRMFCITTGLVQMDSYIGIARLVLLVTMHLVLCFFPVVRPELLGIMAGMDQEAWFAGFDVVPRAVLLLVSQAPDARHHGRLGPQDSVEVHRCSSWTRFSPCPLLCYECLGPDSALHSLASPQLQFFTVVDFL